MYSQNDLQCPKIYVALALIYRFQDLNSWFGFNFKLPFHLVIREFWLRIYGITQDRLRELSKNSILLQLNCLLHCSAQFLRGASETLDAQFMAFYAISSNMNFTCAIFLALIGVSNEVLALLHGLQLFVLTQFAIKM